MTTLRLRPYMLVGAMVLAVGAIVAAAREPMPSASDPGRTTGHPSGTLQVDDPAMQGEPIVVEVTARPWGDSSVVEFTITVRPKADVPLRSRLMLLLFSGNTLVAQMPIARRPEHVDHVYAFIVNRRYVEASYAILDRVSLGSDATGVPALRTYDVLLGKYMTAIK